MTINRISDYQEGAFRYACKSGNLELVKYLLSLKSDININSLNNCAIKNACEQGNTDIVKYLLNKDPSIDMFCENRYCPHKLKNIYKSTFKELQDISFHECSPFCFALKSKNLYLISFLIKKIILKTLYLKFVFPKKINK